MYATNIMGLNRLAATLFNSRVYDTNSSGCVIANDSHSESDLIGGDNRTITCVAATSFVMKSSSCQNNNNNNNNSNYVKTVDKKGPVPRPIEADNGEEKCNNNCNNSGNNLQRYGLNRRFSMKAKYSSDLNLYGLQQAGELLGGTPPTQSSADQRQHHNNSSSTSSSFGRHLKKSLNWGSFRLPAKLRGECVQKTGNIRPVVTHHHQIILHVQRPTVALYRACALQGSK